MSRVILGIDPGPKNVGWAVCIDNEDGSEPWWKVGKLRFDGTYEQRLFALRQWLSSEVADRHPDVIAMEVLAAGRHNITFELASQFAVVCCLAQDLGIHVAKMTPSTHFKFVSVEGKMSPRYRDLIEVMVSREHLSTHELAAAGIAKTALADLHDLIPSKLRGRVRWLRTKAEKSQD